MTRSRAPRALPLAFLAVFFALPVAALLLGHVRPGAVADVITDVSLRRVAWFTLWQACASTVLTLLVGLPATWALSVFTFRGAGVLHGMLTVPFLMPGVVVATGVLAVVPQRGVGSILWAHVVFNTAVVLRVVGPRWAMVGNDTLDAAADLGATPLRAFTGITWPAIRTAVINAATLVFAFCFGSFAVISILGGVSTRTLETEVFTQAVRLGDIRTATALTVVQTVIVLCVLALNRAQRAEIPAIPAAPRTPETHTPRLVTALAALIVFAPIAAVVHRSFRHGDTFTLAGYRALFDGTLGSVGINMAHVLRTSAAFAAITVLIAVPLSWAATHRTGTTHTERLSLAPLLVSSVTLGLGIIVTFDHSPINWRASSLLVPVIHAVIALPLAVRVIGPARRAIDPHLYECAADLGADRFTTWRTVELPLLRPALARAAGISAAVSLGEFGATSFLTRGDSMTIPIAIGQLMGRPGPLLQHAGFAIAALVVLTLCVIPAMVSSTQ